MDTGAYTEHRGEGKNHPHTLTQALGEELSQGTGALLAGFQEGGELSFSIC